MNKMRFARLHKKWHDFEHGLRILFQSLNKKQKNLIINAATASRVKTFYLKKIGKLFAELIAR